MSELIPRKVDPQSRVVLPPEVLNALKVGPGDYVGYEITNERVVIHKLRFEKAR